MSDATLDGSFVRIPKGKWNDVDYASKQIAAFDLAKREVTIAEYEACVEAGVCNARHGAYRFDTPRTAVSHVSADEAESYCLWIGARLPSYHEWQYVASHDGHRVKDVLFPWGNTLPNFCIEAAYSEQNDDKNEQALGHCFNGKVVTNKGYAPSYSGVLSQR